MAKRKDARNMKVVRALAELDGYPYRASYYGAALGAIVAHSEADSEANRIARDALEGIWDDGSNDD